MTVDEGLRRVCIGADGVQEADAGAESIWYRSYGVDVAGRGTTARRSVRYTSELRRWDRRACQAARRRECAVIFLARRAGSPRPRPGTEDEILARGTRVQSSVQARDGRRRCARLRRGVGRSRRRIIRGKSRAWSRRTRRASGRPGCRCATDVDPCLHASRSRRAATGALSRCPSRCGCALRPAGPSPRASGGRTTTDACCRYSR